jgi:CHAT domain-containing protein
MVCQDLTALRVRKASSSDTRDALAEGFRWAGQWKCRTLLEGVAEHRRGGRTASATELRRERRELLARRASLLERISRAIQDRRPAEQVDALREEARTLLDESERLASALREASPRDAALDLPCGVDAEAVRKVLGRGTALVEYAEGWKRLHAYVLTEKGLSFLDLGDPSEIEGEAEEYLSYVGSLDLHTSAAEIANKGRALFDRLLGPALREAGDGIERIVVVPCASLASLPFEALVTGAAAMPRSFSEVEFVLDLYDVCYAPSSPVLLELASLGPRRSDGRALILADPFYLSEVTERGAFLPPETGPRSAAPDETYPAPGRLRRLAETRNEALALAGLLAVNEGERATLSRSREERSFSYSGRSFDLHLGKEASRHRLIGDLRPYSVLHLAAHGHVDRELAQRTAVVLASEAQRGNFTIANALEMDLDAGLVVLSACETIRGDVRWGQGVESLAQAFLFAGARAVVASLWRVDDRTASETMETFYRGALKSGLTHARALRDAKLAVRRGKTMRLGASRGTPLESGHPFFWAPFIYVGLPR